MELSYLKKPNENEIIKVWDLVQVHGEKRHGTLYTW